MDYLQKFWQERRREIIGGIVGLIIGIIIITLGFFKTLVLSICITIGYYLGKKADNKEDIIQLIERLLNTHGKK